MKDKTKDDRSYKEVIDGTTYTLVSRNTGEYNFLDILKQAVKRDVTQLKDRNK